MSYIGSRTLPTDAPRWYGDDPPHQTPRNMNAARTRLCVLAAALCMAPLAAQADAGEPSPEPGAKPAIDAAWRVAEWPRLGAEPSSFSGLQQREIDSRLWLRAGRVSFGVGFGAPAVPLRDAAAPAWSAERVPASITLIGVGYQLSTRSRLYVDATAFDELPRERDLRMGFEFKPAASPALGIVRGSLFRVQWSSQSHVSLRLRSGGLQLAVRSQF